MQAISDNRRIDAITEATRNAWSNLLRVIQQMKETAAELTDPSILSEHLRVIFRDESESNDAGHLSWSMHVDQTKFARFFFPFVISVALNNLFFICVGLSIGSVGGYMIGTWIARPFYPSPVMKAIACLAFREPDVSDCRFANDLNFEYETFHFPFIERYTVSGQSAEFIFINRYFGSGSCCLYSSHR